MDMCYDGTLVMPSSYAVMDEEEMSYVEGGGWQDLALDLLWSLCKNVIWSISKKAVLAAWAASATIRGGVATAIASLPWSRIAAISILTGVVGITVAICRSK